MIVGIKSQKTILLFLAKSKAIYSGGGGGGGGGGCHRSQATACADLHVLRSTYTSCPDLHKAMLDGSPCIVPWDSGYICHTLARRPPVVGVMGPFEPSVILCGGHGEGFLMPHRYDNEVPVTPHVLPTSL